MAKRRMGFRVKILFILVGFGVSSSKIIKNEPSFKHLINKVLID
jgi:hypothetical protein